MPGRCSSPSGAETSAEPGKAHGWASIPEIHTLVGAYSAESYSMIETTLGIMTFFEWAFALASLSKGPNFAGFLHQGTDAQGRIKAPQAKQFEILWLLMLLCFRNKTGRVSSPSRGYRNLEGVRETDILDLASTLYCWGISSQLNPLKLVAFAACGRSPREPMSTGFQRLMPYQPNRLLPKRFGRPGIGGSPASGLIPQSHVLLNIRSACPNILQLHWLIQTLLPCLLVHCSYNEVFISNHFRVRFRKYLGHDVL